MFLTGRAMAAVKSPDGDHRISRPNPAAKRVRSACLEPGPPDQSWGAATLSRRSRMGRALLLWIIGIPIPIILLVWLLGGFH